MGGPKMADLPILFRDRLVRAILEGRKTQTRRVGPRAHHWLKMDAGDRLWVREAWHKHEGFPPCYRADQDCDYAPWKPSIHMPRSISRIDLVLKEKPYTQPIRDITEQDSRAEGVEYAPSQPSGKDFGWLGSHRLTHPTAREAFVDLWDSINDERGFGWANNPIVVVLTFTHKGGN